MKLALASDHAGYELKKQIMAYLKSAGVEFVDFGCGPGESVDYVDYGAEATRRVVSGEFDRAILFCGTGIGMSVVANKFPGIIAAVCWDEYTATASRTHNNANVLCLGGRVLKPELAVEIVRLWLEKQFEGGRHERRVAKIHQLEKENFKK
ncbi:MAG: ribose 5-phosphate isomerase B [Candidatus Aminicenantes bacterium]|nr:ribose 5-phosphate isomerase B [Candidatus Aminicenantes bacterium]